jgi:predicted Rossmann fold nucleotide-binding protein DprA/Smf involved in DNA uptake
MKEFDVALKAVAEGLRSIAQGVEKIAEKLEDSVPKAKPKRKAKAKPVRKATAKPKKAAPKKTPAKKATAKKGPAKKAVKAKKAVTAADTVLTIVNRSKKGVDSATLAEKTGFDKKKIANLVFKLSKQGKIKSVSRGVYTKV